MKKYTSFKRCKCILKYKTCSYRCKCAGKCGGIKCTVKVVKVDKKHHNQVPRSKHILQKVSSENMPMFKGQIMDSILNFLEVCILVTMVHFATSGSICSWDATTICNVYTCIIDTLLAIGIVLPIRKFSKDFIWRKGATTEEKL